MAKQQQHDAQGRFVLGGPGGPGRPKRQTEASYLAVIMEECDLETWRGIVRRAMLDAEAGDEKARHWLASYLSGAPSAKAVTPTTILMQQLLGADPALEQAAAIAAKPVLDAVRYPALQRDRQLEAEAQQEAARAILAACSPCSEQG